jgi:EAL domain-containing protein (putative c-di-GMP-specific phosphodiesterase class I)/PleD family two-component response regulator
MLARDVGLQSPERRRLFQVQLPQRLACLCQRGERLLAQSWDINAMYLLAEDAMLIADACRSLDAHAIADCTQALCEQVAPLLHPAGLPDRAAGARIGELIAQLSRLQLPAALASGALAVAGAIHELGFPLLVAPPKDYWLRFRDKPLAGAMPLRDAPPAPPLADPENPSIVAATASDRTEPLRILIVEDDPAQLLFTESILRNAGMQTLAVADALAALDQLEHFGPELILMGLHMSDCDGIDLTALIRQRERFAETPIVFLSGDHNADKRAEALRAGGDEFLTKPVHPHHLVAALGERVQRVREQRNQRREPLQLAPAGPASRDHLLQRVAACLAMDDAGARAGGLLVFAIEDVAARRARLGAPRFTALFAEIAAFLVAHAGARTIVASDIGDRFLAFNPQGDADLLEAYALNLRDRIARESFTSDPTSRTVFDVGICPFVAGASHAHAMRDAAQNAIDNARMAGRHGVFVVHDVQAAMDAELAERIRFALDGSGFELLFQPIVSLRGEEQEQFQALLRLSGDDCRLHAAAEVIPVATRAGLIGAVDRWTLENCVDLIDARTRSGRSSRLFVSQSLESVRDPRGAAWLGDLLQRRGAAGSAVSLVLRANDAASARADVGRYASAMRALGASVTLADFEADVVGERLLRELPADFIKLSRRYLHLDGEAIRDELHALVELAQELGTRVIAPRVEDARGAAALWTAGVDFIQGNFVQPAHKELTFDFQASVL